MADYIGKENFVEVGGKKYKLARFDRNVLDSFLEWAGKELPHPLAAVLAHLEKLNPRQQDVVLKEATRAARSKLSLDCPEVQSILATPKGIMKITALLFQRHHPELSDKDIEGIYDQCAEEHGEGYLAERIGVASGNFPEKPK